MNIDTGLAVVIVAVLIFYLRLIVLQRQRAKQLVGQRAAQAAAQSKKKVKGKPEAAPAAAPARYSILSPRPVDRAIGVAGVVGILIGALSYAGLLPIPLAQTYWWVPTALGIVAFSWLFKL